MLKWIVGAACALMSWCVLALQPYTNGAKLAGGDLAAAVTAVEQKLNAAGFTLRSPAARTPFGEATVLELVTL